MGNRLGQKLGKRLGQQFGQQLHRALHKTFAKGVFLLLLLSMLGATFLPMTVEAGTTVPQQKIRVGFFSSDGYHIMNEEGLRSGYGYEFLQMLLRYNDWEYEYVGYDKDWKDMLNMLDSGEIDMVTLADKTPERLLKYSYSDEPIGSSSTIMTALLSNDKIVVGDYSTYDGCTVGLVEDSSHNPGYLAYEEEKGFHCKIVYYPNTETMLTELHQGLIDIAVTSNMRKPQGEIILDEFDTSPYYAIVKKGNEDILAGVNEGLRQLDTYSKGWQKTLYDKYYGSINADAVSLSVRERAYIQELKDSGAVIKAAMNPELRPYSYFENGEAKGIVPDIFREIMKRLDIPYEIVASTNRTEYKEQLNSGEVDVDLTAYTDFSVAQKYNLEETDPYMYTSLAMLYTAQSDVEGAGKKVASVADPTEFYGLNDQLIYPYDVTEYASIQEAIKAVRKGKEDVTFVYAYIAEQAVNADYTNKLQYSILTESTLGLSLGIIGQEDHRLLSVLNKGVNSMDDDSTNQIILRESAIVESEKGIAAFAYSHPFLSIVFVALALIGVFLIVLYLLNGLTQKQRLLDAKEFERFVGYVTESYDRIEEINLRKGTKKTYEQDGDKLEVLNVPYIPYDRDYFESKVEPEDLDRMVELFSVENIRKMREEHTKETFFNCRVRGEDGKYSWYAYVIKVIPQDEDHPDNYMIFKKNMQKIREQEEEQRQALKAALENAQKANTAKGAFVSKISHEIRTPLNAIIGYLGMAEEQLDDKQHLSHYLENGKIASTHLLDLINDVLDLSAIENNKLQIAKTEFDFKDVITEVSNVYYSQAEAKDIKFKVDVHGLTEEQLVGDPLRTKQILMNLLSNAVKFTDTNGTVSLIIDQLAQTEKITHISFSVEDTGIGMEDSYRAKLFQPFEQEDAQTARKYGGSGLGLSITKNLVDLLGGTITVHSTKGEGSTFRVVIPFERCKQEGSHANISFPQIRAMIVTPDEATATYVKSLLDRCEVKSDTADSMKRAIKRIRGRMDGDFAYRMCIVDDTDAAMDGREVCKEIAQIESTSPIDLVPIVYDKGDLEEATYGLGVRKIIEKPIFQSGMVDLLMELYGSTKAERREVKTVANLTGMKVLLAEDNAMNMEIAMHILSKAGVEITQAADGIIASETFLNAPEGSFDAILMDIQMPNMDGYTATKIIRSSKHPQADSIPIIALTANAFSEDVTKALSVGMNAHISKPVDDQKLYEALLHFHNAGGKQQ